MTEKSVNPNYKNIHIHINTINRYYNNIADTNQWMINNYPKIEVNMWTAMYEKINKIIWTDYNNRNKEWKTVFIRENVFSKKKWNRSLVEKTDKFSLYVRACVNCLDIWIMIICVSPHLSLGRNLWHWNVKIYTCSKYVLYTIFG